MIRWIPYTFVRTVVFFIAGILLGIYLPDSIGIFNACLILGILCTGYVVAFVFQKQLNFQIPYYGTIALPMIFLAGYVHIQFQNEINSDLHFGRDLQSVEAYRIVLTSYAERKERSWKVTGEVSHVKSGTWKNATGKVLLYLPLSDFDKPFNYGDVLLIRGKAQEVSPPSNPGEFNYKRFLTFRNIFHQHFVKKNAVTFLKHDPPNILMDLAVKARVWSNAVLNKYVDGQQEQAIAAALVLGVTDGLDNELLNAYAATGAMHVLAVSGLHISIIYIILLWFLKPLTKFKSGKWMVAGICIILLWGYAFITGLSPSVLRAVTMFTFMAVGKATSRNTNIYNTLAASGFCLLVFDPYLIMSVGFQLSYIAVIGIVYLQPLMYHLLEFKTWLMDQVWKIICVSVAAQLATFALGLLYFHQFPNYFLLSNLLVIPTSFAVLIFGLALITLSFVPLLANFIGFLLTLSIKVMNFCVVMVEWFPYSLIEGVYITTFQCWLLMGGVIFVILAIQYKKFVYLRPAVILTIIYASIQWTHFHVDQGSDKLTVYNVSGHRAMDIISDGQAWFLTDSALLHDHEKVRFHIRPNRLLCGVTKIHDTNPACIKEFDGGEALVWKGRLIVYITDERFLSSLDRQADILIIGRNAVKDIAILKNYRCEQIIFDSSNNYYYSTSAKAEAESLGMKAHSVMQDGAFEWTVRDNT